MKWFILLISCFRKKSVLKLMDWVSSYMHWKWGIC